MDRLREVSCFFKVTQLASGRAGSHMQAVDSTVLSFYPLPDAAGRSGTPRPNTEAKNNPHPVPSFSSAKWVELLGGARSRVGVSPELQPRSLSSSLWVTEDVAS